MLVCFVCFSLLVLISPVICLIPTAPNKRSRPGQGLRHPTVLSQMGFHLALENNLTTILTPSCNSREIKLSDNLTVYDRLIARRCDFLLARMTGIFSPLSHCPMSSNPRHQPVAPQQPATECNCTSVSPQGSDKTLCSSSSFHLAAAGCCLQGIISEASGATSPQGSATSEFVLCQSAV